LIRTQQITRIALFLALALAIQFMRFPQPITGPAINAILFLTALILGPYAALLIAVLTPGIALLTGIISPPIAPLVPLIMLANAILVLVFGGAYRLVPIIIEGLRPYISIKLRYNSCSFWLLLSSVGLASLTKFGFLLWTTQHLVKWLYQIGWLKITIPENALLAFQLPQLYTALAGGLLAIIIYRYLPEKLLTLHNSSE